MCFPLPFLFTWGGLGSGLWRARAGRGNGASTQRLRGTARTAAGALCSAPTLRSWAVRGRVVPAPKSSRGQRPRSSRPGPSRLTLCSESRPRPRAALPAGTPSPQEQPAGNHGPRSARCDSGFSPAPLAFPPAKFVPASRRTGVKTAGDRSGSRGEEKERGGNKPAAVDRTWAALPGGPAPRAPGSRAPGQPFWG